MNSTTLNTVIDYVAWAAFVVCLIGFIVAAVTTLRRRPRASTPPHLSTTHHRSCP